MTYGLDSSQFIRRTRVNLFVFDVVGVDSGSNNRQLLAVAASVSEGEIHIGCDGLAVVIHHHCFHNQRPMELANH